MDEFAAYLLNNHRDLYKSKTTSKPSILQRETKRNVRVASRKELRHNELFSKRRIPQNMTPIKSDQDNSRLITEQRNEKNFKSDRWQAFEKWKRERDQRKLQEKVKSKPIFKVSKVPDKIDLENVNKVIKGKVVTAAYVSKFAPKNHNFKAPANVKPLYLTNDKNVLKNQKKEEKKNRNIPVPTTRITRSQAKKSTLEPISSNARNTPKKLPNKETKKMGKSETPKPKKQDGRNKTAVHSGWEVTVNETPQKKTIKKAETPKVKRGKENIASAIKRNLIESTSNKKASTRADKTPVNNAKTPTRKVTRGKNNDNEEMEKCGRKLRILLEKTDNNFAEAPIEKQTNHINSNDSINKKTPLKTPRSSKKKIDLRNETPTSPPPYVSPFVTMSRGKNSAKKEYAYRKSKESFDSFTYANSSPIAGANYFTNLINSEINRIVSMSDTWEIYKKNNKLPDGVEDMIDVAIGQSKLLINKKFQQFRDLVEQYRSNTFTEKKISKMDLHGFWDMMYMQVEDINKRFEKLETMKNNDWQELMPAKDVKEKKKLGRPPTKKSKKPRGPSALQKLIQAQRNKKKQSNETAHDPFSVVTEEKTFDGGYFSIQSPVKNVCEEIPRKSSTRKSLRQSLLVCQSPGLTMMKVSQAIKLADGFTPGKSILKTNVSKTPGRSVKTVLFNDKNDQTDADDLIQLSSPIRTRLNCS